MFEHLILRSYWLCAVAIIAAATIAAVLNLLFLFLFLFLFLLLLLLLSLFLSLLQGQRQMRAWSMPERDLT